MKSSREVTNEVIRDQSIRFKIVSDYQASGDQPQAIQALVKLSLIHI